MTIRLKTLVMDNPENPSLAESFPIIALEVQAVAMTVLSWLYRLLNTVSGDSLQYRYA
jgi:hypothetical protein